MRTHIRLAALAAGAAVLSTGGTLPTSASATTPVAAPAAHHRPSMPSGIAYLPANVDLQPTASGAGIIAKNTTSPIGERITVTGPTTIQLQAQRTNASGASTIAAIWSDDAGRTSFRFDRIS